MVSFGEGLRPTRKVKPTANSPYNDNYQSSSNHHG